MTALFKRYTVKVCELLGWLTIVDQRIVSRYLASHKSIGVSSESRKCETPPSEHRLGPICSRRDALERILVICGNEEHLNELVKTINQRFAGIFNVDSCAKTSALCGATESKNVRLIVLSLVGGKADPPWDIFILGHRFLRPYAPVIVEVEKETSPERAYNMLLWGAYETFTKDEDVWEVVKKVINSQ